MYWFFPFFFFATFLSKILPVRKFCITIHILNCRLPCGISFRLFIFREMVCLCMIYLHHQNFSLCMNVCMMTKCICGWFSIVHNWNICAERVCVCVCEREELWWKTVILHKNFMLFDIKTNKNPSRDAHACAPFFTKGNIEWY